MTLTLKKVLLNVTFGTAVMAAALSSPFIYIVPHFSNKEKERIQQMPPAVQRSYEIEKELNKALNYKQGLEAIAASHQTEFKEKYEPLIQEYASIIAQPDVRAIRKEEATQRAFDAMYVLFSALGISVFMLGGLTATPKLTNYLCGDKKEKDYDL